MPELSHPHYTKLTACLNNPRLPEADKECLEEAVRKYHQWIAELEGIECGQKDTVEKLVAATNRYKRFIELELIFDSSENFLYRQKGQLKLDNTILDVLIVRKTKRMSSNIRQEYRTAKERKIHRQEYIDFLDSSKYYPDVFQRMIDKIQSLIDDTNPSIEKVLDQGYF